MPISKDRILFEDDYLLAVNKRSGELVVKGSGRVQKLPLLDYLRKDYPGLTCLHRLDYETSGVVLFAKSKSIAKMMIEEQLMNKKYYRALLLGCPKQKKGSIDIPLPARGKGSVAAQTDYRVLRRIGDYSFVEAVIETGRQHQIRRHFSKIGCPLILDEVYGDRKANAKFSRMTRMKKFFLHAYSLEFMHPESRKIKKISVQIPEGFERCLS